MFKGHLETQMDVSSSRSFFFFSLVTIIFQICEKGLKKDLTGRQRKRIRSEDAREREREKNLVQTKEFTLNFTPHLLRRRGNILGVLSFNVLIESLHICSSVTLHKQ